MPTHHTPDAERALALRREADHEGAAAAAESTAAPHPLLALQRHVGNAQIARMLAQREEEQEQVQAKHDALQRDGEEEELQAKHDALQRDADEEEQVQAKHDTLQRDADEEELQAKHDTLQREAVGVQPEVGLEGGPISAELSGRIQSQRGGGAPLDAGTRTSMEQSFGTSFEDVRVHTDTTSDALNRSISAKAFTTGSDIFFRQDASPSDSGLLAHELTHVVQQRSGGGGGGGMSVGEAGSSQEQEADAVSAAVTSGSAAQAQREAATEEQEAS